MIANPISDSVALHSNLHTFKLLYKSPLIITEAFFVDACLLSLTIIDYVACALEHPTKQKCTYDGHGLSTS